MAQRPRSTACPVLSMRYSADDRDKDMGPFGWRAEAAGFHAHGIEHGCPHGVSAGPVPNGKTLQMTALTGPWPTIAPGARLARRPRPDGRKRGLLIAAFSAACLLLSCFATAASAQDASAPATPPNAFEATPGNGASAGPGDPASQPASPVDGGTGGVLPDDDAATDAGDGQAQSAPATGLNEGAADLAPDEDAAAARDPAGSQGDEPAVFGQDAASPAPSLLEDPAGAISQMLSPPERRSDLPHDLSPWGMFMAADWVVKAVMIGLVIASVLTWTVWLAKSLELMGARMRVRSVLNVVMSANSLSEATARLSGRRNPAALLAQAAALELQRSSGVIDRAGGDGLIQRVASHLSRIEARAGRRMARGTGILATIGSTAPFVGLFGTVWGIMNAFIGISEAQTTNLAIVAPGIAEALLATAIGLAAAIPAVIAYNGFAKAIAGYRQLLGDVASAIERLVSHDLDVRKAAVYDNARSALAAE